jgi:hypothetical protein
MDPFMWTFARDEIKTLFHLNKQNRNETVVSGTFSGKNAAFSITFGQNCYNTNICGVDMGAVILSTLSSQPQEERVQPASPAGRQATIWQNGRGGIRTLAGGLTPRTVFETSAFPHG